MFSCFSFHGHITCVVRNWSCNIWTPLDSGATVHCIVYIDSTVHCTVSRLWHFGAFRFDSSSLWSEAVALRKFCKKGGQLLSFRFKAPKKSKKPKKPKSKSDPEYKPAKNESSSESEHNESIGNLETDFKEKVTLEDHKKKLSKKNYDRLLKMTHFPKMPFCDGFCFFGYQDA